MMTGPRGHADVTALAADLPTRESPEVLARAVVLGTGRLIEAAEHASVTLRARHGRVRSLATSSPLAAEADRRQLVADEGPCLISTREGGWVHSGDAGHDDRWPGWSAAAAELGVRSVLTLGLVDGGTPFGSINTYSSRPHLLGGTEDLDLALCWVALVSRALATAREMAGLRHALVTRHTIGMAQGVMMERLGIDEPTAFDALTAYASHQQRPIRELAEQIVATRRIPTPALDQVEAERGRHGEGG